MPPPNRSTDIDPLIDALEREFRGTAPHRDVGELAGRALSEGDAYWLQLAFARRLAASGDGAIGYKAAYTSPDAPGGPRAGVIRRSQVVADEATAILWPGPTLIEAEVAVRLGRDLPAAPSLDDIRDAVAAVMPALEIVPMPPERRQWSAAHWIALNKVDGQIVLGVAMPLEHSADLAEEAVTLSIDGTISAQGSGAAVLGNPLEAVRMVAHRLGSADAGLRAGDLVMTGSMTAPVMLDGSQARAVARFSRIGTVAINFAPER